MPKLPDIATAVAAYDAWLRTQCAVVEADLTHKHVAMRADAFGFLRATYFRWAQCMPVVAPDLLRAPAVLAVGDVHLENFGLWRDAEGRLAWGINDLDEAARMPFTLDLLRLATSLRLVRDDGWPKPADAAAAILAGYRQHLAQPAAFVLDEQHGWLRALATTTPDRRADFWQKLDGLPAATPPAAWAAALRAAAPPDAEGGRFLSRVAGMGSLGRPRVVLVAGWRGGRMVREGKARVTSAWDWAMGTVPFAGVMATLAAGPYRSPDPNFAVPGDLVIRRLAPDSRKLDLQDGQTVEVRTRLLQAMGGELANLHRGSADAASLIADLDARHPDWLAAASHDAANAVKDDFAAWQRLGA